MPDPLRIFIHLSLVAVVSIVTAASGVAEEPLPAASADEFLARFDSMESPSTADQPALAPGAADFNQWEPLLEECDDACAWDDSWRPMDRLRQWGFKHSSTSGRHMGRGLPLERTSWLNRPFHVDWFAGPLLGDDIVAGTVSQQNDVLAGVRLGWDIDYYWGFDWRFGWASPALNQSISSDSIEGSYFVSDVDVVYYPWGDSKVRPYFLAGLGVAQLETVRTGGQTEDVTLLGMPFGAGIRFLQTPWLAWRLEVLDNLALGNDGVRMQNAFSFTAGMEYRFGGRRNGYWPWRTSRRAW